MNRDEIIIKIISICKLLNLLYLQFLTFKCKIRINTIFQTEFYAVFFLFAKIATL